MPISMRMPSYHADPHVTYLSQLLDDIKAGDIQVPKFQRPLVWGWEDRLELLRSIRDGIPMGAVMVWRSSVPQLQCYQHLGPHQINKVSTSPQYLLDGVQRLSTLLGALSPVGVIDDDAEEFLAQDDQPPTENFSVHFDFESNDFVREQDIRSPSKKKTLPMNLMLDSVGMLKFQRSLNGTEDEVDQMISTCDNLSAAFREYKLPVIPIVTDDIEMATRTFQRLNSQGKQMSEAHMIHALSWGSDFDLNAKIRDAKVAELTDLGWADLDDDVLLKACKLALGFGVYSKSADDIGAALKTNQDIVPQVGKACGDAVKFLVQDCRISRLDLLPYALQLVLLTDSFRVRPSISAQRRSELVSWFWTTTYGEYFAGFSGDRVEKARKDLEWGLKGGDWSLMQFDPFEVKQLNRKFDFRSVRAKAFALRLSSLLENVNGDDSSRSVLLKYGRESLLQVLPRTHHRKVIYSSYANRFLVSPKEGAAFKERLLNGHLSNLEMEAMLIDDQMLDAISCDDHERFLDLRSQMIAREEQAFYQPHLKAMGMSG